MKKRILSLLLALVTVFYILPIGSIPAIALNESEEETGLSIEDMEVGKLYKAEFVAEEFEPYARYPFMDTNTELDINIPITNGTEELRVVRQSKNDFSFVYLCDDSIGCLGEHTEYRYIDASKLHIFNESGTFTIDTMEIGKEYKATWATSESGFTPYRKMGEEEAQDFVPYYFADPSSDGYVSTEGFPKELIIELTPYDEYLVYITNEDWPEEYNLFRYVDPEWYLNILGEYNPATITYNGEEIDEITLYDDGKMPLKAVKPEGLTGDVKWTWEILVDAEKYTWARIYDKETDVCNITYALVKNTLDENNQAKVRAVANDGKNEYISNPVTISLKYVPRPMEKDDYENITAYNEYSAKSYSSRGIIEDRPNLAAGDSTAMITITVEFIRVRPDGSTEEAAHHDKRTLRTDYEEYTIDLPPVLGYYPSMVAPSDPYDYRNNPGRDDSFKNVTIAAGKTSDETVTIYYYPGVAEYKVYHYKKNVYDDNYTQFGEPTTHEGLIGKAIDDCHLVGDQIPGFYHLYYEHAEVAADGSTVIEIHYDREYYAVLFHLEKKGAHGQENLYVQYETEVGINDAICQGWTFNFWELMEGNPNPKENLPAGRINIVKITDKVVYKADWTGAATTYSIVYWLENANDGNYSIWWSSDPIPATSGGFAEWNKIIPDDVKNKPEYDFVSLNLQKTNEEMYKDSSEGVLIEGDGSTTVDIYFNRRTYNITFELPAFESSKGHIHDGNSCEYEPIYCTHVHSGACVSQGHEHDSTCVPTCGLDVHMHESSSICCTTHVHNASCYSVDADMTTSLTPIVSDLIEEAVRQKYSGYGSFIGSIISWVVNETAGDAATEAGAQASSKLSSAEPPQNLQNGYVYILTDQTVHCEAETTLNLGLIKIPISINEDIKIPQIPAVYIDNGNDNPNDDWYYYTGDLANGEIASVDTNVCKEPDHDHTSGCEYLVCTNTAEDHEHVASCYKCGKIEHVHNDLCYTGCGAQEGCGQHYHTADCYGNVCSIPTYETKTETDANGNTTTKNITAIRIQAKYGQDITEQLPYYLELYALGMHRDANGYNFRGWQYAGTGWADTGETRYVKHVTMIKDLCYSRGVTATAVYDETATNAYILYYLFESFDQVSGVKDYALDGSARQQYDGVWYDADPKHVQLVMWPDAGEVVDGGLKTIEGMSYKGMASGTLNLPIGTITTETLNAYFYERNTDDLEINIYNASEPLLTIPNGDANPLMYGLPLKQLAEALKNSDAYGRFDINNIPYPDSLEAGGYTFAGWYSTPYISEHTRIDWDISTMPNGQLNLYALWEPVIRYVEVYEDETLSKQFGEDNHGSQEVGHRSFALQPEYEESNYFKNDYIFNGWFYKDATTGEEKAFLFNFPITQDMKIYAKWISQHSVEYCINFVVDNGDGTYTKVADSKYGTSVAGQNKTFRAAVGEDLYSEYRHGFFPRTGSHTLQMIYDEENPDAICEYNFIYDEVEEVPYWVRFVDNETDEEFDSTNPKYPAGFKVMTRQAAVTELFIPIEGYTVDYYSKTLILSTGEPEKNNVITFYYTKNETDPGEDPIVTAPWVINHYIQNVDGSYSLFNYIDGGDHPTGTVCYGEIINIDGYEFVDAKVLTRMLNESTSLVEQITIEKGDLLPKEDGGNVIGYGYALNMYGMEINLYYDRINMGYTIKYQDANTGEIFHSYVVSPEFSVPHGHQITVDILMDKHMDIVLNKGRNLVDPATQRTWTLNINPDLNVFTFYYEKYKSTYEYHIVCDDPDSGVGLSMTVDPVDAGETNPDFYPVGSMPYESDTYYFAGWFLDEDCNQPINKENAGENFVTLGKTVVIDGNETEISYYLTPTKRSFEYTEDGVTYSGELFLEDHYYALFLPRAANIEITVNTKQSDSFILTFTGTAGTALGQTFTVVVHDGVPQIIGNVKIGTYTVAVNGDWSWRYGADSLTKEITVSTAQSGVLEGYNTFELSLEVVDSSTTPTVSNKDKWLTDDASGTVTPTVTP